MPNDTTPQRPKTHSEMILDHLKSGQTISTWEAYQLYNITCLAQRIHDLRNLGYDIASKLVTHNGKTYSEYRLAILKNPKHNDSI